MRGFFKVMVVAAAMIAGSQPLPAQDRAFDDGFWQSCPTGSHYACWYETYGGRFCGCWHGGDRPACPAGFHFACRPQPNGYRNCACY